MTKFSVIIPLYNKEKHIKNTLNSALAQTFQDFEVLVINDGSTDHGADEVMSLKDERISIFNIENHGVSYARNFGISKATSDFIAFLDADDFWYPRHLEELKILIDTFPDCGLYVKGYECLYYDKSVFKPYFLNLPNDFVGIIDDYFYHSLINQIAWTSAVVIPKHILDVHGYFDVTMKSGQDTELWTRIALKEKVALDANISAKKIITSSHNHLSLSGHVSDRIMLLNRFKEQEKTNESLKRYMDLNRFSVAIERKMAGDMENFNTIRKDIHANNLNKKQKLLLSASGGVLKLLKKIQMVLIKNRIYLSPFR